MTIKTAVKPLIDGVLVDWTLEKDEIPKVAKIVERGMRLMKKYKLPVRKGELRNDRRMDIVACHNHIVRLDFDKWIAFDDFNFTHDFFGITKHIDRNEVTMKLFTPRCAR